MYQILKNRMLPLLLALIVLAAVPFGNMYMAKSAAKTGFSVQLRIGKEKVTKKTYQMDAGASVKLKVKALTDMKSKKSIKITSVQYQSSNKKAVSIRKNGVIRAKSAGTAKITVTVKTRQGKRSAWMKVRANESLPDQEPEPDQQPDQIPQPGQQPDQTPQPDPIPDPSSPSETGEQILIAYFTRSGNAEKIADMIADKTGGTKFRIETENAYPEDYNDVLEQESAEREQNARPALKTRVENMSDYDTIFLGYPIWFGDVPMAVHSFLESYDFTGKKVIPFCTSGSSSPQTSYESVRASASGAEVLEGFWTRGSDAGNVRDEVNQWIDGLGILDRSQTENTAGSKEEKVKIAVGSTVFYADLEDNSSAAALKEMLADGSITIDMEDYGDMEKVGPIGKGLPRNDENITTGPGDLILYQGNSLVIYYDTNTWNFTRLGKIEGVTKQELLAALGDGSVTVTLSL